MSAEAYADFLARKAITDPPTGLTTIPALPDKLFPFQRDITSWALRRGRAALFAGTGLGKSFMELAWADAVHRETGRDILHLAPLAVSAQIVREADKFGIAARQIKTQAECLSGVNITNYQKLDHFDLSQFGGVILDESSILKSQDGHYRTALIEACAGIPFRLAATATPSPNDFMELGNHAEFLGVMSYTDMLATFFTHDGSETQKWRLKGHAEDEFWKWMATWAVMLRKPSDLGYANDGYDLPQLNQFQHAVSVDYAPNVDTGMLFPMQAQSLSDRISARRATADDRVARAVQIIASHGAGACLGKTNTKETDDPKLRKVLNTLSDIEPTPSETHERQKTIANTCEPTTAQTKKSGGERPRKKPRETLLGAQNMCPETASGAHAKAERNTSFGAKIHPCEHNMGSDLRNTTPCLQPNRDHVLSADEITSKRAENTGSGSITATGRGAFADYSAATATWESATSPTTLNDCGQPSHILSEPPSERWIVWCNLNSEQDALERLLGEHAISVRGSNGDDENERRIMAWLGGDAPVLIGKPSMLGFGLNFQCCSQMIFVGLNDSFEQVYQAVRRCWRFGQTKPVNVHFIASEIEGAVVANLKRKEMEADRMSAAMVLHMADLSSLEIKGATREKGSYHPALPMIVPDWIGAAA